MAGTVGAWSSSLRLAMQLLGWPLDVTSAGQIIEDRRHGYWSVRGDMRGGNYTV